MNIKLIQIGFIHYGNLTFTFEDNNEGIFAKINETDDDLRFVGIKNLLSRAFFRIYETINEPYKKVYNVLSGETKIHDLTISITIGWEYKGNKYLYHLLLHNNDIIEEALKANNDIIIERQEDGLLIFQDQYYNLVKDPFIENYHINFELGTKYPGIILEKLGLGLENITSDLGNYNNNNFSGLNEEDKFFMTGILGVLFADLDVCYSKELDRIIVFERGIEIKDFSILGSGFMTLFKLLPIILRSKGILFLLGGDLFSTLHPLLVDKLEDIFKTRKDLKVIVSGGYRLKGRACKVSYKPY